MRSAYTWMMIVLAVALAGCTTSLKDLDDLSLVNTKEVRAEKRQETAQLKAEIAETVETSQAPVVEESAVTSMEPQIIK